MSGHWRSWLQALRQPPGGAACADSCWTPSADVYCTRTGWLVKFDLAGVRPEDVRLAVSGGRLLLSGIRRDWCIEDGCNYYRMEIAYSNFARGIELPVNLEAAELTTEFQEGMLLVRIKEPARE